MIKEPVKENKFIVEFTTAMIGAVERFAKQESCDESKVSISLSRLANNANSYGLFKDFSFVKPLKFNDVLPGPQYFFFRSAIEKKINDCLERLSEAEGDRATVFVCKSKQPGKVRLMVYVKNVYKHELSVDQIVAMD